MNRMVLAGFICFLLSYLLFILPLLGILLFILSIIINLVGLQQIKKNPEKWKGKSLEKTVLLIVAIEMLLALLLIALVLIILPNGFSFGG